MASLNVTASGNGNGSSICTTVACQRIASVIVSALAPNYTNIDPCTNFDKFACGGWVAQNAIPAGKDEFSVVTELQDRIALDLKEILEAPYPSSGWITTTLSQSQAAADRSNFERLQKAYTACVNNTPVRGLQDLRDLMEVIAASYPVSGNHSDEAQHGPGEALGRTLSFLAQAGIPSLVDIGAFQNSTASVVEFMPGVNLDDILYDLSAGNPDQTYVQLGAEILSTVHPAGIGYETSLALMRNISDLERKIYNAFTVDESPNRTTLSELGVLAPHLNLSFVAQALAPPGFKYDEIRLQSPSYFRNTSRELLLNSTEETIQGFFMWKAIRVLAPWVDSNATNKLTDHQANKAKMPTEYFSGDAQSCIKSLSTDPMWINPGPAFNFEWDPTVFSWMLSRFFVESRYSQAVRRDTDDIILKLKQQILSSILQKDWVSDKSKKAAEMQLKTLEHVIGYPSFILDAVLLQNYSAAMNFTDSHLKNALALARFAVSKQWTSASERIYGNNTPSMVPTTVNARYIPLRNAIDIPAAIARYPDYVPEVPSYVTYGLFGSVLGHELTHLFDGDVGALKGWDQASVDAFKNKSECLVNQYNNFTVTLSTGLPRRVDGRETLRENIADHGGVRHSFAVWKHLQHEKPDLGLPGLKGFTNDQLFFLRAAQWWCQITGPNYYENIFHKYDTHSPKFARILGEMANSRDFKEAYGCAVKEPVCEIW